MSTPSTDLEPYIDRSYYYSRLLALTSGSPPHSLIGQRNPYTGKTIRTMEEAEQYLQQRALSETYKLAANKALAKVQTEANVRIRELEGRVADLEKKRRRPWPALLLVIIAFVFGSRSAQLDRSSFDLSAVTSFTTTAAPAVTPRPATAVPKATKKPAATAKPKATATPKPAKTTYKTTPKSGYSLTRTVYVSQSGGKIHLRSNCSGMKYYNTMTYGEACERGYTHCKKCF